jgi:hypothetical protein
MEFSLMHKAKRAFCRLALLGWLGLLGVSGLLAQPAWAAAPPERILPESTVFLLKVIDVNSFRTAFRSSQYGQFWNDPGLKDFRDELVSKMEDTSKSLKEKIGVSLKELFELPQGTLAIAAIGREDPSLPVALTLIADAGENEKKMLQVLERTSKQAEEEAAKVSTESFSGLSLHIVQFPKKQPEKDDKEKEKDKEKKKDAPTPPLVWTNAESLFFITTDLDVMKDLVVHREQRDNSLAATDAFTRTQAKTDSANSQVIWFLDVNRLVKAVIKANTKGGADEQQMEVLAGELGVNGLKSVGGCLTFGTGNYDSLTKTFFNAPKPVQGLLKIFSFPPITLRPESWVPATVASYQTLSFDLDNAFAAVTELVNKFQPGMVQLVEQQLVGPEGGAPLSFQNDVFGPLGDRVTVISDFKKPVTEDSQRMLLAVALEDTKAFQNTLSRLFQITNAAPQKREFQGHTIYDFAVNLPNEIPGNPQGFRGPISIAVAKDTLFITNHTTLLEQVLRPGNATLGENTSFQTVAKEYPEKASGLSYARPDESARVVYDMFKSGRFAKSIQQAAASRGGGRDVPDLGKLIPGEKLPDFAVLAKYLSLGGSYSLMDDDGFTLTGFTLRRTNP